MKMKKSIKSFWSGSLLSLILILGSCSVTKTSSQVKYAEAWQEVLKSQAWKDALITEDSESTKTEDKDFYVSSEDVVLLDDKKPILREVNLESNFETKYDILVRRAYVRIIAQASKADNRLEKEYILRNAVALKKGEKRTKEFDKKLELVNKRYHAHREMLEGLKSWNIFSKYGTDDLEFFKAENQIAVREMIQKGKGESAVINFLIYKLADLYHFEG